MKRHSVKLKHTTNLAEEKSIKHGHACSLFVGRRRTTEHNLLYLLLQGNVALLCDNLKTNHDFYIIYCYLEFERVQFSKLEVFLNFVFFLTKHIIID